MTATLLLQGCTLLALLVGFLNIHAALRQLQRNQHEYVAQAVRKERERLLIENAP